MSEKPKLIPADGVSKKLKIVVIMLTVLIFLAFIALFNKFSNRPTSENVPAVQKPRLSNEYQEVGTRLINAGLKEQAIDQFIKVWQMQKIGSVERSKAAQTVGRLYADLGNCQEALVWLFRTEASGTEISEAEISGLEKTLAPLIDACLAKVRGKISGQ